MDLVFWCSWCNSYSLYKKAGVYFEWYIVSPSIFSLFESVFGAFLSMISTNVFWNLLNISFTLHTIVFKMLSYYSIVCTPPSPQPLCWGGGSWTSNQIFIKGVLDRTSTFRGGCWERGRGDFFQEGCWLQFSHTQKN